MEKKKKTVILKISGGLLGDDNGPFSPNNLTQIVGVISDPRLAHFQFLVIPGGGNLGRGRELRARTRHNLLDYQADRIGMAFTAVNAIFLQAYFEKKGIKAEIISHLPMGGAISDKLEEVRERLYYDRVVILANGTGEGGVSTDTAAVRWAIKLGADPETGEPPLILKGTAVEGVYTADPTTSPSATLISSLSHDQFLELKGATIFDRQGVIEAKNEGELVIRIFSMLDPSNLASILLGAADIGSVIHS